jgi:hypothetical protein
MLCYVINVMLCYGMVCYVMLCYGMVCYGMLWYPFNTPASAVGVGGGGFHGIRSVGGGAQPLRPHVALPDRIAVLVGGNRIVFYILYDFFERQ